MDFPPIPQWIDLRPDAMPRPIDRRIRLARLLARGLLPDFAEDWADDLVSQTAEVLRGVQAADAMTKAALELRGAPKLHRGEVEARLLAEQEPADVAAAMGLPAAVVDAYAKLFFDLTGNLNARSWMMHEGIGSKAFYGLMPDDTDVILKLVGFRDGLGGLEPAVRYYRRGLHLVADLDAVPDLDPEAKAWARGFRAWIAARILHDPNSVLRLRAAFPETKPEPVVSPGLHHRVTLDMAAEAVARTAEAPRTLETPAMASAEGARKPARRRTAGGAGRRTGTRGRKSPVESLAAAGT